VTVPDFFLVGAARSGTTSVYRFLQRRPEIFIPKLKEPKFFSSDENTFPHRGPGDDEVDRRVITDPLRYGELFEPAGEGQLLGEASVDYLYFPGVASRLQQARCNARILILLRDPAERAFSAYRHLRSVGRETLSFGDALLAESQRKADNWEFFWLYREVGLYSTQVERFLDTFSRDQVLVILFDDLCREPRATGARILEFLGASACSDYPGHTNTAGEPRWDSVVHFLDRPSRLSRLAARGVPRVVRRRSARLLRAWNRLPIQIDEPLLRQLRASYIGDIERLQRVIDRDLSCWLRM
jgi:hypothetical protein